MFGSARTGSDQTRPDQTSIVNLRYERDIGRDHNKRFIPKRYKGKDNANRDTQQAIPSCTVAASFPITIPKPPTRRTHRAHSNSKRAHLARCRQERNDREKEKRGGESRRMLGFSADMSTPLVRFGSVSRQEIVVGSGGNAKHPRNCSRTAPAQDQPSTPREG
eukprot:COSAG05_NODE_91_length_19902_cov_59.347523_5_plen_163_part_00